MTRPDEAMEKVLAGLRDVEAPVGMERRILERLENVAEVRRAGWRLLWLVGMGGGVGAAAILIALAIPAVHLRGPVAVRGNDVGAKAVAGREALVENTRSSVEKKQVWGGVGSVSSQRGRFAGDAQGDDDSVAMSEMRAASFPAPPMPLTDEEKLLLRMVHQGDPVELAMLDPKMEALRDAEEKAEFQRFFAKAAVKESEGETIPATDQAMPSAQVSPVETAAEEPKREPSSTAEKK
jgi:hypothetical protein